jgi:hypothetical protein
MMRESTVYPRHGLLLPVLSQGEARPVAWVRNLKGWIRCSCCGSALQYGFAGSFVLLNFDENLQHVYVHERSR